MLFEVERTTVSGRPVFTVRGELDLLTAPQLGRAVDGALQAGVAGLIVDLTPTVFLDSSGARELMRIARAATDAGAALHVLAPLSNSPVRLIVDLLDLGALVPIVESMSEIPARVAGRDAST